MVRVSRVRFTFALLVPVLLVLAFLVWHFRTMKTAPPPVAQNGSAGDTNVAPATTVNVSNSTAPTHVYAHNLLLRKGPTFRVYVRWLRGQLTRSKRNVTPSFDDPESFFLDISTGVLRANIGDLANYLNSDLGNSPLKNIALSGDGDQIKLTGTLHKVIPIPIQLAGTIEAVPENRIRVHVTKLDILKVPLKGLLGKLHVTVSDLFQPKSIAGVSISGNDIFFDSQQLLPPPHIRGQLKKVKIANPDLEEIYGDAREDVERTEEWRNYLHLKGGTIDFGKLTMKNVDLIMIDISKDAWFDLDLANYQNQLVNGYTHMTPEAGLQIFMPDLRDLPPSKANKNISIEWLKNRNVAPPPDVYSK